MRPLLVLVLAGTALSSERLDRHPWSAAHEVAGPRFIVETNTFREVATSLQGRLERAYTFYEDRFGPLEGPARRPMRIALFRTRREYLELGDGVAGAVGHFDAGLDRCALIWHGESHDRGWPVAVHEACHHYFRRRFPDLVPPSWYTEGIACYFEGLLDPGGERAVSRLRIRAAKSALKRGDAKLSLVLRTRARVEGGKLQLDNFAPTRYYGLAWSLVHFLASDPRYSARFRRFEMRLFASMPAAARRESHAIGLLKEECGDLATLERRWRKHLQALPEPERPAAAAVYAAELESPRAFVRYAALRRLQGRELPGDLRSGAVRCASDRDLIVRTEACRVLRAQMDADAVPALTAALDLGDPELKRTALKALAHRTAGAAVPRLLAEDEDEESALQALAVIGDKRAFPALRQAVKDPRLQPRTRARCAAALAHDPRARNALQVAARSKNRVVRNAAHAALARHREAEPEAAAPAAIDPQAVARNLRIIRRTTAEPARVIRACRELGAGRVDAAIPALRRLCRPHLPDRVRLAAARALVSITGEARGFEAGQPARARERAYRALALETE